VALAGSRVYVRRRRFCTNNTAARHRQSVYTTHALLLLLLISIVSHRCRRGFTGALPGNGTSYKINRFLVVISALPAKA